MSNKNQVEAVEKALGYMQSVEQAKREIEELDRQKDSSQPKKREIKKEPYPVVKSEMRFGKTFLVFVLLGIVISFIGIGVESAFLFVISCLWLPAALVYYFKVYKPRKDSEEERIRTSPEYVNACREIDRYYEERVRMAEKRFAEDQKEYNEKILPGIQNEIDSRKSLINSCDIELTKLLDSTKLIPLQYQNIPALQFLYDVMSTSEYDIKEAIDLYEKNQARIREEEAMRLQAEANAIENAKVDALEESNYIAERARRDQRRQAVVDMVQNHNRNKSLDWLSRK